MSKVSTPVETSTNQNREFSSRDLQTKKIGTIEIFSEDFEYVIECTNTLEEMLVLILIEI